MKEVLFGHEVSTQMDFSRIRGTGLVRFPYLLVLLAALVLADRLITVFLVAGGLGREGNPFLRGIVDNQAHLGGFVGGYFTSRFLDPLTPERGDHLLVAVICIALTALSILVSIVTALPHYAP